MKRLYFFLLLTAPMTLFAQSFTVQEDNIDLNGSETVADFSGNTYLDATMDIEVNWEIISVSLPDEWEFSNCFPNCYPIGVTSGTGTFAAGSSQYLNCHVYPHNIAGEGTIQMEITDDQGTSEVVTWNVQAETSTGILDLVADKEVEILNIYDLQGRELTDVLGQKTFVIRYTDGTSKTIFVVD